MTTDQAKQILTEMAKVSEKVFKTKSNPVVQTCLAIVITGGTTTATIRLLDSPDDASEDFEIKNNSGETLVTNDEVWIHYWGNNYTNAYIAIKNT